MLRSILMAALLAVLALPARAEPPKAGPHLTAAEIRALRPTTSDVWRLTYRDEENGAAKPLVLSIAADYVAAATDQQTTLYDFRLARLLTVKPDRKGFTNDSLYALVVFRAQEIRNRRALGEALAGAKIDEAAKLFDQVRAEAELSMVERDKPARPPAHAQTGDRHVWHTDKQPLAEMVEGPAAPEPVRPALIRAWRHAVPLHPAIAQSVAATGKAPRLLDIPGRAPDKPTRRVLTLESAEWVTGAEYPLPADAKLALLDGSSLTAQMVALARDAVRKGERAPGLEEYMRRMQASAARGQMLEASLWGMEAVLATGTQPCRHSGDQSPFCASFRRAMQEGMTDPRAATIYGRGPLKRGTPKPDLTSIESAYVGRLLMATRFTMGGQAGPEEEMAYLDALQNSPGVVNFYKDIGDMYVRTWRHALGWQFFDLARLLPGHGPADMLAEIDRVEARVKADMPELF